MPTSLRAARQAQHIVRLERRLFQALGQDNWHTTGLEAPNDVNALQQQIADLDQGIETSLRSSVSEDDPAASRATHRELMSQLNNQPRPR
ncbi:hypothetical protein [Streptomyces atroolivaceus]|uniref:Uncharacterized protein n=1 Tax=Streptomyces atroolivaceus TaxID=66869 RepID=A0ABV9VE61_STRAZ|nr:hypothetical protein [Streptomyces atroolivaceus]